MLDFRLNMTEFRNIRLTFGNSQDIRIAKINPFVTTYKYATKQAYAAFKLQTERGPYQILGTCLRFGLLKHTAV